MSTAVTNPSASDAQLVAATLAGQRDAFGAIVERYQGLVTGVLYNRCRGDVARSEELAQDTFVTAWQNLAKLQTADRLSAWLCGIARNVAHSAARDERRGPARAEVPAEIESLERDPAQVAISRERAQILWQTLAQIPETYREPMILFYRQEKSTAEVARALELSEPTVRKRLQRGRAMLKEHMVTLVEETLSGSAPNPMFTAAVLAALPVMTAQTAAASTGGGLAVGTASTKLATGFAFLIAPLVGVMGGLLGAWHSFRQARSSREKRFIITATMGIFVFVAVFVGLQMNVHRLRDFLSATQYGLFLAGSWLAYAVLLTVTVFFYSRRHRQIREQDGSGEDADRWQSLWDKPLAVRASMAGAIFGGVAWMVAMAGQAGDWVSVALITAAAIVLYAWSTRAIVAGGSAVARRVVLIVYCALLLITTAAVNLRFNDWFAAAYQLYATGPPTAAPHVPLWLMNFLLVAVAVAVLGPVLVTKDFGQRPA